MIMHTIYLKGSKQNTVVTKFYSIQKHYWHIDAQDINNLFDIFYLYIHQTSFFKTSTKFNFHPYNRTDKNEKYVTCGLIRLCILCSTICITEKLVTVCMIFYNTNHSYSNVVLRRRQDKDDTYKTLDMKYRE